MSRLSIYFSVFFIIAASQAEAQGLIGQDSTNRVITTAVPFMMISPDARSGGMGEAGVAISADANAIHWNVAKLPFVEDEIGFSLSYTPWLSKLVNDMSVSFLSGYMKIDQQQSVGLALRYFDLGDFNFTNDNGDDVGEFNPREFSFEGSYARMLSEDLSIGITLKYIYSNLTGNYLVSYGQESQPGTSVAGDIGLYWKKNTRLLSDNSNIAIGATITNIGAKMTYSDENNREFIPTIFRLGGALTEELDPFNKITLAIDLNKLMVPSPPIYQYNEDGTPEEDPTTGKPIIRDGKDPDRGLISGMFGSFADAPDGFGEELQEIMWSTGIEYWYNDTFAARAGYYFENQNKGNRKYFTLGLGLRYNVFGIDFAYLVPTKNNHPLAETLRFTLHFDFDRGKALESVTDQNN